MVDLKIESSISQLTPKDKAIVFLKRVELQAEYLTHNKGLISEMKKLEECLDIDVTTAQKVETLRRKINEYRISSAQTDRLCKSLRYLEALLTPLEVLKEVNLQKKKNATIASKVIVEDVSIGKEILAIILDGTVSREIAVPDSDIDIAVVVKDVNRPWQDVNQVERSICQILNSKKIGVIAHDNMDSSYNHGGIHLRVIEESDLDSGNVLGTGLTPRDGVVLYEKSGFSLKEI